MYYTDEQKEEVKLQLDISKLKEMIKARIRNFTDIELSSGFLSQDEEEDNKKLYSNVISKLNKEFYGLNVSDMSKYLKQLGYSIPNNNIIYCLNINHLKFYRSLLCSYYKKIETGDLTYNLIIGKAVKVGQSGHDVFVLNNAKEPIDDLIKYLDEIKAKNIDYKKANKELKKDFNGMKKEYLSKIRSLVKEKKELQVKTKFLERDNKRLIKERKK